MVYVDAIDPDFLMEVLVTLNISVCEFIIKSFDDAIFYVNHIKFAESRSADPSVQANATPIMYHIIQWRGGLPLMELLLQNGADPNVPDVRDLNQSLLSMVASEGETDYVNALLMHGARVHARQIIVSDISEISLISDAAVKQRIAKAKAMTAKMGHSGGKVHLVSETLGPVSVRLENSPLADAIEFGHPESLELLLAHGAYTTAKNSEGLDALGMATMLETVPVNAEVVRLLQQNGAKLNAVQGLLRLTPLNARVLMFDEVGA